MEKHRLRTTFELFFLENIVYYTLLEAKWEVVLQKTNCMLMEEKKMKHIKTINKANLSATAKKGGCGKCQASCQSACKTSCTVGNQKCANDENK